MRGFLNAVLNRFQIHFPKIGTQLILDTLHNIFDGDPMDVSSVYIHLHITNGMEVNVTPDGLFDKPMLQRDVKKTQVCHWGNSFSLMFGFNKPTILNWQYTPMTQDNINNALQVNIV